MNNQCGNCYLPRHLCKCRPVSQEDCEKAGEKAEAKPCLYCYGTGEEYVGTNVIAGEPTEHYRRCTHCGERVSPSTPPTRQMILEEIRHDPGTTLYGIPMPEVTRIIIEHQQRQRTTPVPSTSVEPQVEPSRKLCNLELIGLLDECRSGCEGNLRRMQRELEGAKGILAKDALTGAIAQTENTICRIDEVLSGRVAADSVSHPPLEQEARECAEEIMQPYWKDTRTMDYWEELDRERTIIEKYFARIR